jgi:hypothetical protein
MNDEPRAAKDPVPNFDLYFLKPMCVFRFITDDGDVQMFEGTCRGSGPEWDFQNHERTVGMFREDGKFFAILIDTRVHCALPQFVINNEPFHYPIVSCHTLEAKVDPVTGRIAAQPAPDIARNGKRV